MNYVLVLFTLFTFTKVLFKKTRLYSTVGTVVLFYFKITIENLTPYLKKIISFLKVSERFQNVDKI